MGERKYLPPESPRDQLDRLIDWYERYKPEAGKIIPIKITFYELWMMVGNKIKAGEYEKALLSQQVYYRGRMIRATK